MSDENGSDVVAIDPTDRGLDECVLINCHRPARDGIRGEHCAGHAKALENAFKGVEEPELERRLKRVRVPPPSVEYVQDPEYVFPEGPGEPPVRGPARRPQPASVVRGDNDDTLVYLSDALEGRHGALKALLAPKLLVMVRDVLESL